MQYIFSLEDINKVAASVWNETKSNTVLAFHGLMGAGKTTFIGALCKTLNIKDGISSPTFAIINEYESQGTGIIYHMDLYRLKDEEEAMQAGVDECLQSGCLCLVEWPEKMAHLLPEKTLHIFIEMLENNTRKIVFDNKQIL